MTDLTSFLQSFISGKDLQASKAEGFMRAVVGGDWQEAQLAGALVALQMKGATPTELAAFARVLQEHAIVLRHDYPNLVDTCGTGGGIASFNLSTAAAIVASATGTRVAKHGNRGVTSSCGSADVLEALGVRFQIDPEQASHLLETVGLVFLFAPAHHPVMKVVGPTRKALGIRTVFNQLGPLLNPARASRQLIGVYDLNLARPMAEALGILGSEHVMIVRGRDGLDEISACAETDCVELRHGEISERVIEPEEFGIKRLSASALQPGSGSSENAAILQAALSGSDPDRAKAIIPNAAAAIYLSGNATNLKQAADMARQAIESGEAIKKLNQLIETTQIP